MGLSRFWEGLELVSLLASPSPKTVSKERESISKYFNASEELNAGRDVEFRTASTDHI